jgi:MFS family permease
MTTDERAIANRLIMATTLNGFVSSVGAVQDIIAKKALGASDWQIALLAVVWPISNFFSIWWGKYLERTEDKSPYYYVVAVFSRLILLLALWVTGFWHLFFLLVVFYSFNSLFIPLQNSMLQGAFQPIVRGRVFGWMTSIATLIIMAVSYFGGRLLDAQEWAFRPMFAVFGVIGFLGTSSLAFIKYKPIRPVVREPLSLHLLFVAPILRARHLMRDRKSTRLNSSHRTRII